MKKPLIIAALAASALALSGCDIFELIPTRSESSYSVTHESFSSEVRDGYERVSAAYTMYDVGPVEPYELPPHHLASTGNPKVLVLPIEIKGYESRATSSVLESIKKSFGAGDTTNSYWVSLKEYYKLSSYGLLDMDIIVPDEWYECGMTIKEINTLDVNDGAANTAGVEKVMGEAYSWYKSKYNSDGTELDSDEDGYVDAVWCIYSCPDYQSDTRLQKYDPTCWAYTYSASNEPDKASPTINAFSWASYTFLYEGDGSNGQDAHTIIHETGHLLGLDDYYDYNVSYSGRSYSGAAPMGLVDMMDANIIDHCAYSKFVLGWVNPFLADKAGSITISPTSSSGDCIIVPTSNGWNGSPFDEYLMVELYTPDNLNYHDVKATYSNNVPAYTKPGVRITHVDSRLGKYKGGDSWEYYESGVCGENIVVAHTNTPSENGEESRNFMNSKYRLIQLIDASGDTDLSSTYEMADDSYLFHAGDAFAFDDYSAMFPRGSRGLANDGGTFSLKISIDSLSSESATISFAAA